MCGIAGIIDFRGRPIPRSALEHMNRALAHRGPDDAGLWTYHSPGFSVGLAHTRLAVIDPTPQAHQPMTDPAGRYAITYNGELYNYRALRDELPIPARTASDTEVALNACIAWGPEALRRFDAMWALAFVDTTERTGHLSRDPFGIKPLYYLHHDDRLIFASELPALYCLPDLPADVDPQAVACYLNLGYVPHPQTIFSRVRKLPPGHLLRFSSQGPAEPQRYHVLHTSPAPALPFPDAADALRRTIESAVVRQRIADRPLGAFLSGGLDSAIVVACLARTADTPVKTFTIGYPDHPRYDETAYARIVAHHFHTDHHSFPLGFKDILETVEPMLNHLGEPFADSSLLPTSLVSRYTRDHVVVALSGDGGDELFGGYWRYLAHHYLARVRRWPRLLRRGLLEHLLRLAPAARSTRRLDRLRQARKLLRGDLPDPLDRHLAWARHLDDALAAELLGEDRARKAADDLRCLYMMAPRTLCPDVVDPSPAAHAPQAACAPRPFTLQDVLLADLAIGLPGDMLHKVDTASMVHSLEVRVPFLSVDLVDFAAALPIEYKLSGGTGKRILREAFRDILPKPILRRRKMGFEVPVGEFLRHELRDMYHDVVTTDALCDFGLNPRVAARLVREHATRRHDRADLLWALLVLCHWHRQRRR